MKNSRIFFLFLNMQPVYIKTSNKKLLKQYGKVYALFLPFLLMYFFAETHGLILLTLVLVYYIPLTFIFVYELISNQEKTAVELNTEGIKIYSRDFFDWERIYEFRTVEKKVKTKTLRRGTEISKKHYLKINESSYNFESQYLDFTTEQIAEIIGMYKQRLDDDISKKQNLPQIYT